jgi:excisionase family DNA binding protein
MERTPLFVRIPTDQATKLDRAAEALGIAKSAIVARLLEAFPEPEGSIFEHGKSMPTGRAWPAEPAKPDVLTLEQLAALLSVDVEAARSLAESGELPGRKIAGEWRFSRAAILDWLRGS